MEKWVTSAKLILSHPKRERQVGVDRLKAMAVAVAVGAEEVEEETIRKI
jgi:hypothetical protein